MLGFKFAGSVVQRSYLVMVALTQKQFRAQYGWFSHGCRIYEKYFSESVRCKVSVRLPSDAFARGLMAQCASAMAAFSLRSNVSAILRVRMRGSQLVLSVRPAQLTSARRFAPRECIATTNHVYCTRPYCSDQSDALWHKQLCPDILMTITYMWNTYLYSKHICDSSCVVATFLLYLTIVRYCLL